MDEMTVGMTVEMMVEMSVRTQRIHRYHHHYRHQQPRVIQYCLMLSSTRLQMEMMSVSKYCLLYIDDDEDDDKVVM
jgi:hypothetical protein